ncbi:M15 family metallopeptidase [bacterium]|nr:M15 family metallopeptidase [bacterium]
MRLRASLVLIAILFTIQCARPPKEQGVFLRPDLVELIELDPTLRLNIRYATSNNFLGRPVYKQARAFLQRPAAEALTRAHQKLKSQGYGLLIFDGYRPWSVTKKFWDATPLDKKEFVADPQKGSRHNRGCAVDLTLFDLKTGKEVEMPGRYDEMTERSHINYSGGSEESRRLRDILRAAMESEGFVVYEPEWWHYDYQDWQRYPILNKRFSKID